VLGALPLLIYPFCLLANVMSLAAANIPTTRPVDPLPAVAWKGFLWGSTIYPAVYVVAAGITLFLSSNDRETGARRVACFPLVYLVAVLVLLVVARATGA
jgi:hypothetical protein